MSPTVNTHWTQLVLRGEHGGVHSLAHVNDGLGGALAARGYDLVLREPRSGQLPLAASRGISRNSATCSTKKVV